MNATMNNKNWKKNMTTNFVDIVESFFFIGITINDDHGNKNPMNYIAKKK